jgi:hypothetical protein
MHRRLFIRSTTGAVLSSVLTHDGRSVASNGHSQSWDPNEFDWKQVTTSQLPNLNGYTDTVPDIVGRIGAPIGLAIFTEGNHFPVLLGGEIIETFRAWAHNDPRFSGLDLENIVLVTLPQPMVVAMIREQGIQLGNLILEVSRRSGLYPDVVMGGATPLTELYKAKVVGAEAHVFAQNRGLLLLVRADNPLAIHGIDDLKKQVFESSWQALTNTAHVHSTSRRSRQ